MWTDNKVDCRVRLGHSVHRMQEQSSICLVAVCNVLLQINVLDVLATSLPLHQSISHLLLEGQPTFLGQAFLLLTCLILQLQGLQRQWRQVGDILRDLKCITLLVITLKHFRQLLARDDPWQALQHRGHTRHLCLTPAHLQDVPSERSLQVWC